MKASGLLIAGALVTGFVVLLAHSSAEAAPPNPQAPENVQTAMVGDRLYTVVRLGEGNYLVALVSKGGVPVMTPVNVTFNQSGPLGEIGDAADLAQLKADLSSMSVDFHEGA